MVYIDSLVLLVNISFLLVDIVFQCKMTQLMVLGGLVIFGIKFLKGDNTTPIIFYELPKHPSNFQNTLSFKLMNEHKCSSVHSAIVENGLWKMFFALHVNPRGKERNSL